jgi:predicted enzyme related to lactoylglutathione lyase
MPNHPIVHVEIPAVNPKASSQFYADVFGWQINPGMPEYPMFNVEGGPAGGFTQITYGSEAGPYPRLPGQVLIYLQTDDIDANLTEIEAHGGKTVLPRTEIQGIGWWGVFADPSGTQIGLFTPGPREEPSASE